MTEPEVPRQGPAPQATPPQKGDSLDSYHTLAETVGFVPNIRLRDNVIQAIIVAVGTAVAAVLGYALHARIGALMNARLEAYQAALIGAFVGLIGSALISGVVLMVLGLVRAANRKKPSRGSGT